MNESRARELLVKERDEVASLLRGTEEEAETGLETNDDIPRDFGDEGEPLTEQGNDEAVAEELQDRLDAIDRALARLEAGTYGRSVLSGKPIPDERLEADPAAELTVEEARARACLDPYARGTHVKSVALRVSHGRPWGQNELDSWAASASSVSVAPATAMNSTA